MSTEHRPAPLPPRPGQPAVQATARPGQKLPAGLRWDNAWRATPDAALTEGEREVPVDAKTRLIAGRLFLCPSVEECGVEEWVLVGPDDPHPQPGCAHHLVRLVEVGTDPAQRNPVTSARSRLRATVRAAYETRRDRAVDAARVRAEMARAAAATAAKRTGADMRGHLPSLSASAAALLAGEVVAETAPPLVTAAFGVLLATGGAVVAYIAAYVTHRLLVRRSLSKGTKTRAWHRVEWSRKRARHVAAGVLATGLWLLAAAVLAPLAPVWGAAGMGLAGALGSWTVNRSHWDELWSERRRLKELAARRHEEAAAQAEREAEQLAQAPAAPSAEVELTAEEMGRRMAARWAQIARSDTVPFGFLMARTRIVPEETVEITALIDGQVVRIGWEYSIEAEPGVLVGRVGGTSPLVGSRMWLASMLGIDPALVSLIDQPEGRINHAQLTITDQYTLNNTVRWKGPDSVRRDPDGSVWVHNGTTVKGDDVYEPIYIPGQPFGGLTVGHTGAGKSVFVRLSLLNDLAAGIFPTMYDPAKSLADFAEFVGVFPMGCTVEHRDVILRSLHAERVRRTQHINTRTIKDRHGRRRPEPAEFDIRRDGPPIRSYWEEFHRNVADKAFVASFVDLLRVQRSAAMGAEAITQGGGLADLADSVLRGLLNQVMLRLFRMPDNLARLAGYTGTDYMPSSLPRVPGTVLLAGKDSPPVPLRSAFVTREDVDGSVYDWLYAPDGSPLLAAPKLPKETVEVFEREGLMDLWRLGQRPDGLSKLMEDNNALYPTAAGGVPAVAGKALSAADVVLAIVASHPGCDSARVYGHEAWRCPLGGGKEPVPSTVSRAAGQLEKDGLLTRVKRGNEYVDYRVTDKGQARASTSTAALLPSVSGQQRDAGTAAELERQAEAAAEQLELELAETADAR